MKNLDHPGDELSDAPGADLEALFDRGRAAGFTNAEADALWGRVGAALAAPSAGAAPRAGNASGATTAGGAGLGGLKIVAAVVVVGGLVAGTVAYRGRTPAPAPVVTVYATRTDVVAAPLAPVAPTPAVLVDDLPRASETALSAPRPKTAPERREIARNAGAARAAESLESTPRAGDAPAPPSPAQDTASVTRPAIPGEVPASDTSVSDARRASAASVASPDPGPTEGALLLRARQELSSDPSDALVLTQEHARRFPAGTLVQEREVLAIEALARLGRSSEARRRLQAFRASFPQSPHVARLTGLVGQ